MAKQLTPTGAATRFLNGSRYIHHVSYSRAAKMLKGELPLDPVAVMTMADRHGIPYLTMKELIEEYINRSGA
jgi:hypothetical protein